MTTYYTRSGAVLILVVNALLVLVIVLVLHVKAADQPPMLETADVKLPPISLSPDVSMTGGSAMVADHQVSTYWPVRENHPTRVV